MPSIVQERIQKFSEQSSNVVSSRADDSNQHHCYRLSNTEQEANVHSPAMNNSNCAASEGRKFCFEIVFEAIMEALDEFAKALGTDTTV